MEKKVDIGIIGGGISGLSLAWYLSQDGASCILLEKDKRTGGALQSKLLNGFTLEYGPNAIMFSPELEEITKKLDLRTQKASKVAKNRFILLGDKPKIFKVSPLRLFDLRSPLSFKGKVNLLFGLFRKPKLENHMNAMTFMSSLIGKEAAHLLGQTLLSGIYAGDSSKMMAKWIFPRLWNGLKLHGSLFAYLKNAKNSKKKIPCSISDGNEGLASAMGNELKNKGAVFTEEEVLELLPQKNGVLIRTKNRKLLANRVVLCTQAAHTAKLISELDEHLGKLLRELPHAPLGVLHLAIDDSNEKYIPEGFGILIHPKIHTPLLGVLFPSILFKDRAPKGKILLTCLLGGASKAELANVNNENICQGVMDFLCNLFGFSQKPEILDKRYWPKAIAQYEKNHDEVHEAMEEFKKKFPAISFFSHWQQMPGVTDRIALAKKLAKTFIT